jgi:hypothetical protein
MPVKAAPLFDIRTKETFLAAARQELNYSSPKTQPEIVIRNDSNAQNGVIVANHEFFTNEFLDLVGVVNFVAQDGESH